MEPQDEILKQIDASLAHFRGLRPKYSDMSDIPLEAASAVTSMRDCIQRFAPEGSQYLKAMNETVGKNLLANGSVVVGVGGVLTALRNAYASGYLATISELIHADVFANFTEMADHLLSEGYKDPAAVIIGSTLEEHLRQLCVKSGLPTDTGGRPKKADQLNADLAGASVYSKLDLKSITSWLDLRNKAAHGRYTEYTKEQVALMIQGIRDFMTRNPA